MLTECAASNWRLRTEVAMTWSNGQKENPSGNSDVLRVRSQQDCEHPR